MGAPSGCSCSKRQRCKRPGRRRRCRHDCRRRRIRSGFSDERRKVCSPRNLNILSLAVAFFQSWYACIFLTDLSPALRSTACHRRLAEFQRKLAVAPRRLTSYNCIEMADWGGKARSCSSRYNKWNGKTFVGSHTKGVCYQCRFNPKARQNGSTSCYTPMTRLHHKPQSVPW